MAGVKGRHEARKRVCHRARTLSSVPLRSSTTAFRDNSTSVPNRGGLPVLGPCQWHRPYRARSRSNRVRTSVDGGARGTPSPVDGTFSVGAQWLAGAEWRGAKGRAIEGGRDDAWPRRSRVSAKCHPIPVGLPHRSSASQRTLIRVCIHWDDTRLRRGFRAVRLSSSSSLSSSSAHFSLLLCSIFLPKYFCSPTLLSGPFLSSRYFQWTIPIESVVSC